MANWYKFKSQELFDVWHDLVKSHLGIPYANKNLETGEVDANAQWTTSFIEPVIVKENDLRIYLTDEYEQAYSEELGELTTSPYDIGERLKI
jgi:hypothetical protein